MHPLESYTLPPDKLALAMHYAFARHILYFGSVASSAIVLLVLIWTRFAPRMRHRRLPVVIMAVYAVTALFELPLEMIAHSLSLRYGISIEPWTAWFVDWAKAEAVGAVLTILGVWGFYVLVRQSPRRWWFYAWLASVPLIVFGAWIEPYALEPLFNQFQPLAREHAALLTPIEALLGRAGVAIPADHIFEMKASAKTNALNAYVSGFGSSKRVVLYDTIIRKEPEPALMTTFGHELGHYVLHHIAKGITYAAALLLFGFWIAYALVRTAIAKWGARFDVRGVADAGSLPVFALVLLILSFLGEPIGNAFSRLQEHQADAYSLEVTKGLVPHNGEAAAQAFQIEGENALEVPNPDPLIVFWLYTHPPVRDRFRFSLEYGDR